MVWYCMTPFYVRFSFIAFRYYCYFGVDIHGMIGAFRQRRQLMLPCMPYGAKLIPFTIFYHPTAMVAVEVVSAVAIVNILDYILKTVSKCVGLWQHSLNVWIDCLRFDERNAWKGKGAAAWRQEKFPFALCSLCLAAIWHSQGLLQVGEQRSTALIQTSARWQWTFDRCCFQTKMRAQSLHK